MECPRHALPFWRCLSDRGDDVALVDVEANVTWTYRRLGQRIREVSERLRGWPRSLLMLFAHNDIDSVVFYLAALEAGHAIYISPVRIQHASAASLIAQYRPELIVAAVETPEGFLEQGYAVCAKEGGARVFSRRLRDDPPPNEALALILSTSASSGSAKSARLSATNLAASAAQVAGALGISEDDRPFLGLPISYVYGLSVLNSALHAGASVALVRGTPADRAYWDTVARSQATMISAVSQMLQYMRWLRIDASALPSVRKVTHSGDALDPGLLQWMCEHLADRGIALYLMYGQTEACGRIAVLAPEWVTRKYGSVGKAIAGGHIGVDPGGEIIYRGPGVMLGYATRREDLTLGDTLNGVLNTGDVGRLDTDEFLYITGRLTRYRKVFGRRICLDDIESHVRTQCAAAALEKQGVIVIFMEGSQATSLVSPAELARQFQLPPQCFRIESIDSLPRTDRGKVDYPTLLDRA